MPELRLVHGGKNVVDLLSDVLEAAKRGEVDVVALAACRTDGMYYTGLAAVPGAPQAFLRAVGSVSHLNHDMMSGELQVRDA